MKKIRTSFFSTAAISSLLILSPFCATGQDSPSLGDAARQARLQKQQGSQTKDPANKDASGKETTGKDTSGKDAPASASPKKVSRIITNEEIPEHTGSAEHPPVSDAAYHEAGDIEHSPVGTEGKAQALKAQIASMKNYIASLEGEIENLNNSIHFASGNCVANCVQWNERQVQKQQQVEQMKAQLEDQKKHLEDTQESARQQGFGSAVYDP